MKKYFAWVFFVIGAVNVVKTGVALVLKPEAAPPGFLALFTNPGIESLLGCLATLFALGVFSLFFYLWWRLK